MKGWLVFYKVTCAYCHTLALKVTLLEGNGRIQGRCLVVETDK